MRKIIKLAALLVCMTMVMAVLPGAALAETEGVTADGLKYQVYDDHVEITGYTGNAAELEIPGEIESLPVTVIADRAFYNCISLTSVTIPDSVIAIGNSAFYSCDSLTGVTIPDGVTVIGREVFEDCHKLTSIDVAQNNPSYADVDGVLFDKTMTKLIQYPNGSGRVSYEIPDSVTAIDDRAFFRCSGLTSVTIPNSVTAIGNGAFWLCFNLMSIDVAQDNPSYVGMDGVLFDKTMTKLIQYPIGNGRKSYNIPDSVTEIGECSFFGCKSLSEVTMSNSVTIIGVWAFSSCTGLANVTIPGNGTGIYTGTFYGCTGLTSVTIGDGFKTIGTQAFYGCTGLTSVTIPKSVTYIDHSAFSDCDSLTDVYYAGSEVDWANVSVGYFNDPLRSDKVHFNSTGPAPEIKVTVNGALIDFDVPPTAIDGTTMLPVRYALEPLGAEFVWDGENQTVTVTAKGKTIVLTVGSATALVDGEEKTMTQPAMAIDGRTLIPIRFVSEELGYNVDWDGETSTVIITG